MSDERGEPAGIDPPPFIGPESRALNYGSAKLKHPAGVMNRRPPARRTLWLDGFPWRELAWSALAGALAAVLAVLALLWSGWTIW